MPKKKIKKTIKKKRKGRVVFSFVDGGIKREVRKIKGKSGSPLYFVSKKLK